MENNEVLITNFICNSFIPPSTTKGMLSSSLADVLVVYALCVWLSVRPSVRVFLGLYGRLSVWLFATLLKNVLKNFDEIFWICRKLYKDQ